MTKRRRPPTSQNRPIEQKRPEDRSAADRLRLMLEASVLREADVGEFLRRRGLHEADLVAWREAALSALSGSPAVQPRAGDAKRVRELEKELRRKDKALAETTALLALQEKVRAIWGDEDTKPGSDDP